VDSSRRALRPHPRPLRASRRARRHRQARRAGRLCDGILLAPLHATVDYGYAVTDHLALRADFGTPAELRRLVDGAHRRGLKVILDFVPNHTSDQHRFYRDTLARGPRSPWYRFYERDRQGRATHHFDWVHLPNLDHRRPEVQRLLVDALLHWVRAYRVDGFRLDAAWAVQQRSPGFLPAAVRQLRRERPDLILIAEASARDPYWTRSGFDLAYDWSGQIGRWAWDGVFAGPAEAVLPRLDAALRADASRAAHVLRFLNNNDTGRRFISRHGLARTRVATALLLTLPCLPLLFVGDEIGAELEPYAPPVRPIVWRDHHRLRRYTARLVRLRRRLAALHSDGLELLGYRPGETTYAYLRRPRGRGPAALVLLNFGAVPRVTLPATALEAARPLEDLLTGERLAPAPAGDALVLPVRPLSARVLIPAPR